MNQTSSARPTFLWVTDPWETLDHPNDTTLRLVEESLALGYQSLICDVKSIRLETSSTEARVVLDARPVLKVSAGRKAADFQFAPTRKCEPSEFTRILYRPDPPVDLAYLHPLQLLVLGTQDKARSDAAAIAASTASAAGPTEIISPAPLLFSANEKMEGVLLGAELVPPSVVSSQWETLQNFGRTEGRTILKPLFDCQSKGIELLVWDTEQDQERARQLLILATESFTRPVLLQRYLPGITQGEQRLWYLNGVLLACVRKRPKQGQVIINMDQGGSLALTELNDREKNASEAISRHLKAKKIRLAAVDLIDGYVTDFNFTSPGLLAPMEKLLGENLAQKVIQSLAKDWH